MGPAIDRLSQHFFEANGWPIEPHLVVLARVGSHSHGTYLPPSDPSATDDTDLMGFVIPPIEYHLGLKDWEHWIAQFDELDITIYSLKKAWRLLLKGNPNSLCMLWLRDEDYIWRSVMFLRILESRCLFSSQRVANAFAGYAHGQLCKMTAFDMQAMAEYEKLLTSITAQRPPEHVLRAHPGHLQHIANKMQLPLGSLLRFRSLHAKYFSGYMGEKRKAAVRRFGYDAKNASHLIRLLRMSIEFLQTGQLHVFRSQDAEDLKAIKRGEWSLERVQQEAELLFTMADAARALSLLPDEPRTGEADKLLIDLQKAAL